MLRPPRLGTSTGPAAAAPRPPAGEGRRRRRILASIIVPCYNEEAGIEWTIEALRHELVDETVNYEFIFIDDHSTDRTGDRVLALAEMIPGVKLVQLGSNCGSHVACRAGLDHCAG